MEMKAYSANYRRLLPGRFEQTEMVDWMRKVGANRSECAWMTDQVEEAVSSIEKFFEQTKPEISSAVALYLKHTEFPLEVTRNIAAFASEDEARVLVRFG